MASRASVRRVARGALSEAAIDLHVAALDPGKLEVSVRRDSKPEIEVPKPVSFATGVGDEPSSGYIVRLSVAGVEIESLTPPPAGREVSLKAVLVDGEGEVALQGRVQWSQPARFAVQFGSLGARATRAVVHASQRKVG
jgi:hypothetical protein